MIKILVISAQAELQSYLSGARSGFEDIAVDYCQNLESVMKKIPRTGSYDNYRLNLLTGYRFFANL